MYSHQHTNELSGLQVFAVNKKWYEQYVIGDFESDLQIPQIDNYSLCICREEQTQVYELQNKLKKDFNINAKITILNIQEQVFKTDKWTQTKFVSKEEWENLIKIAGGGPCIPLYIATKKESNVARIAFKELKFLTVNEVPELKDYLVIGTDMQQMEFLIQNDDDTFIYLNKVVPSSFTIEQVIIKILTPQYDLANYDYFNLKKNIPKSTLIHELQQNSLWFFKHTLPEDFDDHVSRDMPNYHRDTTESTTESRDLKSSFLDITTQQQQHEIEDLDNLMLRAIEEFKNDIENILKNHKNYPLILLKPEQALENINHIISLIEQDNCLKKEEEGTNDELIEQDI